MSVQTCQSGTAPASVFENNAGNTSAEVYTPLTLTSTGGVSSRCLNPLLLTCSHSVLALNPVLLLQSASYIVDFLVNYDDAQSLVILTGSGQAAACCTLYPPMPDFPTCGPCCAWC